MQSELFIENSVVHPESGLAKTVLLNNNEECKDKTLYKKGSLNTNADTFSQIPVTNSNLKLVTAPRSIEDKNNNENHFEQVNIVQNRSKDDKSENISIKWSNDSSGIKENSIIKNKDHDFQHYFIPNSDNYANDMRSRLKHILQQKEKSKIYYDPNSEPVTVKKGDQILLRNKKRDGIG